MASLLCAPVWTRERSWEQREHREASPTTLLKTREFSLSLSLSPSIPAHITLSKAKALQCCLDCLQWVMVPKPSSPPNRAHILTNDYNLPPLPLPLSKHTEIHTGFNHESLRIREQQMVYRESSTASCTDIIQTVLHLLLKHWGNSPLPLLTGEQIRYKIWFKFTTTEL